MKELRKSRVLLVVLVVVVGACASLVTYGQPDCCSDHGGTYRPCDDPENPYDCGYCTWWAWQRAKEASGTAWVPGELRDAHEWDDRAPIADPPLAVGKIPLVGAIAVWEANTLPQSPLGHVAYVEGLQGTANHAFRVSEMNYPCINCITYRDASNEGWAVDFIYPLSDRPVPLWPYNGRRIAREDTIVLQWYGNFDLYYIWYNIHYDDGDHDGGIPVDIQGEQYPLSVPRPAWVTWLLCGYNASGGDEVCADLSVFYAGPCPESGAGVLGISALAVEDYCGPDYYPTPIPTSTPFPTATTQPTSTPVPTSVPTVTPTSYPTHFVDGFVTTPAGLPEPISNVGVCASGLCAKTDDSGHYRIEGLATGTHTVTPSKSGYVFGPPSKEVTLPPDAEQVNFTGTPVPPPTPTPTPPPIPTPTISPDETPTPTSTPDGGLATPTPSLPTPTPTPCTPLFEVGDFDCDCEITVADIMIVASRWRCREGDECYDQLYDLDRDGDIDIVDIMRVSARWGETC